MLVIDEDAVTCDLAETYRIYNYRNYPPTYIATLAAGLRDNARIKLKMNDMAYPLETMLMVSAVDKLSLLLWAKTKDGASGRNRPKMLIDTLLKNTDQDLVSFETSEEFEDTWKQLAGGERIGSN